MIRLPSLVTTSLLAPSLVLATGCFGGERSSTGQCPVGETCSVKTPYGLDFIGNALVDQVTLAGPIPTAIGGTQDVSLEYNPGTGIPVALDLAYTANDDGGADIRVDHTAGPIVTVRGVASGENYLRILDASDGTLFDRKTLTAAEVSSIDLVTSDFEYVPLGRQIVWAPGAQTIGVAISGLVQESAGPTLERVIDTHMQLALAGATQGSWDAISIANATVGTTPLAVTAGDLPTANVDVTIVDGADALALVPNQQLSIAPNTTREVCFEALNQSRFVAGLTWAFTVSSTVTTQGAGVATRNCINVTTQATSGTIAVQASAGGQSAQATLTVGTTSIVVGRPERSLRETAGERARM